MTWGEDGTVALLEKAKRTDDISGQEAIDFVNKYYIGKSRDSDRFNVFRTALNILGYDRRRVGRVPPKHDDYKHARCRENQTARRWRLQKDKCEKCSSVDQLRIHHIIPVSWGGKSSEENCITLCEKCHREAHREISKKLNRALLLQYLEPHAEEIKRLALQAQS